MQSFSRTFATFHLQYILFHFLHVHRIVFVILLSLIILLSTKCLFAAAFYCHNHICSSEMHFFSAEKLNVFIVSQWNNTDRNPRLLVRYNLSSKLFTFLSLISFGFILWHEDEKKVTASRLQYEWFFFGNFIRPFKSAFHFNVKK